jgi:TRAP-type C4-dicarboxylate transport system substrate-binding protein
VTAGAGLKFLGLLTGGLGDEHKREIRTKDDLKGLKIRTMPIRSWSTVSLGCMGVAMGPGELYSALQQGVIDGISLLLSSLTP